jgi:hypothetical protein
MMGNLKPKIMLLAGVLAALTAMEGCMAAPATTVTTTITKTSSVTTTITSTQPTTATMPTTSPTLSQSQQPIEIISVLGPLPPINPGGPIVEITLKNVSNNPVIFLTATLRIQSALPNQSYDFDFNVSASNPLSPNTSISQKRTLIGGGFADSYSYPLTISGTFQNGNSFGFTEQVMIASPPTSTLPMPTTTTTSVPITFDQATVTVTAADGLSLTLSIDSTIHKAGDKISITIDEKNTLPMENKVQAAGNWPVQGLNVGTGGRLNYPFGISILQGYYNTLSVASITALTLYDPNATYHCPMILVGITAYDFRPSSNTAGVYTSYDSQPLSLNLEAGISPNGFWSGSPVGFSNFTPGIYTVVGQDEWGTLVILHFIIS